MEVVNNFIGSIATPELVAFSQAQPVITANVCKLIDLLLHSAPDFRSIAGACLKNDRWTVCASRAIQEHLATAHFNKMRILLAWTRQNCSPNEVPIFACGGGSADRRDFLWPGRPRVQPMPRRRPPRRPLKGRKKRRMRRLQERRKRPMRQFPQPRKPLKATADGTEKAVKKAGDAVEKAKDVVEHQNRRSFGAVI